MIQDSGFEMICHLGFEIIQDWNLEMIQDSGFERVFVSKRAASEENLEIIFFGNEVFFHLSEMPVEKLVFCLKEKSDEFLHSLTKERFPRFPIPFFSKAEIIFDFL